jgi:hypothetical protein
MIGTRDQLIERLGALSAEGLSQVMILPSWDTRTARSSRWRG